MPGSAKDAKPLLLVWGDDEFSVKRRAKEIFQEWGREVGAFDQEIVDASASNSGEALKALTGLREALQTLPLFGAGKVVWFQNCNFMGEERVASAQAVTESLTDLARELKEFEWRGVRLLISAGRVDKRRTFYKTLERMGSVESFGGWSIDDRDWEAQAENWAAQELRAASKTVTDEALAQLVNYVGPNARQLSNEIEKLVLFTAERPNIEIGDVNAIVTRNKQARAFALADALGERNLPKVLRTLDEELWEMKFDSQKSEIGLLYGLISKIRAMIFLKEMVREGWVKADGDFTRFKGQLERIPAGSLPEDKRFSPRSMNPYMLFKALPHAQRYSTPELLRAMELLLECNQRLVLSSVDESLALQQTLVQIVVGAGKGLPRVASPAVTAA